MSDLFHPHVEYEFITEVFAVMKEASQHMFQVLTKRPGRAHGWWKFHGQRAFGEWPMNVWIGTSVESQKYAPRLTVLGRIPAATRFVSAEPLLERLQSSSAGVAFFLKQLGGRHGKRGGESAVIDGKLWREMPDAENTE